tara:strand:- start:21 stop:671 length:651 start_codon:yes stop_codon:yes gene_type:complete
MNNYLKIFSLFFLSLGIFFAIGIFALKIVFQETDSDKLIILGPDNKSIISKPLDPGGKKISNLDIEILNNKDALIKNEKIRPKPVKPELLPLEVVPIEKKILKSVDKKSLKDKKISKSKQIKKNIQKSNKSVLLYRVQFGSFRNLNKAKLAKKNIEEKYANLLLETNMEIFSYTNNENLLFHRVWTTLMNKDNGLKLCQKFKKEKIVCILQVNKKN